MRIYVASKMTHADKWRELYNRVHIVSRWPFLEPFIRPTYANARKFWQDDMQDIESADAVLVYAEEGEHLRGALVEVGAGLALGKRILLVGDHVDYGTWKNHPQCFMFETIEAAVEHILR